jgi:hypothetical protein
LTREILTYDQGTTVEDFRQAFGLVDGRFTISPIDVT